MYMCVYSCNTLKHIIYVFTLDITCIILYSEKISEDVTLSCKKKKNKVYNVSRTKWIYRIKKYPDIIYTTGRPLLKVKHFGKYRKFNNIIQVIQ